MAAGGKGIGAATALAFAEAGAAVVLASRDEAAVRRLADRSATVEERYLAKRFPDTYPSYKQATRMFLPFVL